MDILDGDTFSSAMSIPDENDTEVETFKEFEKINEKITISRSGTTNTQESEPIKVYIMKFKSKLTEEAPNKQVSSNQI